MAVVTRVAASEPTQASVGRFRVLKVLGEDDSGTVYAARDPSSDRTVALKVFASHGLDAAGRSRWAREAQAMTRICHPNVLSVVDAGLHGRQPFVATELVRGTSLHDVLRRRRLPVSESIELFAQIARGLHAVHDAGLVHWAFTPQNVLVAPDTRPLLTDFSIAGPAAEAHTSTGTGPVLGTPRYMAPEQVAGQPPTAASNQFSFGVALYEVLFSRHPFVHTDLASLRSAVLEGQLESSPPRRVPSGIRTAVLRCLQRNPDQRFASMLEVADALESVRRPTPLLMGMGLCVGAGLALAVLSTV